MIDGQFFSHKLSNTFKLLMSPALPPKLSNPPLFGSLLVLAVVAVEFVKLFETGSFSLKSTVAACWMFCSRAVNGDCVLAAELGGIWRLAGMLLADTT